MTISMDGYQPASVQLLSEFNIGWFLLDLILTGPFVLISFAGGLYDVSPGAVFVTLQPLASRTDLEPKVVRMSCEEKKGNALCSVEEVAEIPAGYQPLRRAL